MKSHLILVVVFSLAVNLLLLVSPLFMLQVYDRVLSSGSLDTLIFLTVIAIFLLAIYGAAEAGRRRACALASAVIEEELAPAIFDRFRQDVSSSPSLSRDLAHLSRVQAFLQNGAILPFADLPFAPLFLGILFLIHPLLGLLGLAGAAIVFAAAWFGELSSRGAGAESAQELSAAARLADGLERQRSAIVSMGLGRSAFDAWQKHRASGHEEGLNAARLDARHHAITRSFRQMLQILVLAGGAALALSQQISPGAIVAGSIILARALGPIDQIVGGWRNTVQTWRAWKELDSEHLGKAGAEEYTPLPRPDARLELNRLAVGIPGADEPLLQPFSLTADPGSFIVLAGAIGSGKTSLLQTLAGAWPAVSGKVSLGGRDLHAWAEADRGRYVGYVPQDVELLPATVAENISRLSAVEPDDIVTAARLCGAHEVILSLSAGYDTRVGPGGQHLSAGQAQLIGCSRAMFSQPPLVLLDEPTANLDAAGAAAMVKALRAYADGGALVIAATHDRRVIASADTVLLLRKGSVMSATSDQYLKLAMGPGAGGQGAA